MKKSVTVRRCVGSYIIKQLVNCCVLKLVGKYEVGKAPQVDEYRVGEFLTEKQLQRVIDGEAVEGIEVTVLAPSQL